MERYTTHFGERGYTVKDTQSGEIVFTGKKQTGSDAKKWAYEHNQKICLNNEICNECGKSVKFGSGLFVNRVIDLNSVEDRIAMAKPFPDGDFICSSCEAKFENKKHKNKMAKKLTPSELQKMDKPFPITSLCRVDLLYPDIGYSISKALKVTDAQMERIAGKLADDYCTQLFWGSLKIIAESVLEEK